MNAVAHALLAVLASGRGDQPCAHALIKAAEQEARDTARRDRQLVEIAASVVAGDLSRAKGLAVEHEAQFMLDAQLVACLTGTCAGTES
jgi:hypothetical protein